MYLYIINFPNNKKYIGITTDIDRRKKEYSKKIKNPKRYVERAIKKYGFENTKWDIKDGYVEWKALCEIEISEIKRYNSNNSKFGYNMTPGGEGIYFKVVSKSTKHKISQSLKGKMAGTNNPFFGKKHSEETKRKISNSNKGKMSGKNNHMFGKTHSIQTRNKISQSLLGMTKGVPKSTAWKKQMSIMKSGDKAPMVKLTKKQVIQIRYDYVNEKISYSKLGKKYGVSSSTVWKIITNKTWKDNK